MAVERIEIPLSKGITGVTDAVIDAEFHHADRDHWRFVAGGDAGTWRVLRQTDDNGRPMYKQECDDDGRVHRRFFGYAIHFTNDPEMAGRLVLEVE